VTIVSVVSQTRSEVSAKGARAQIGYAIIEPISAIADGIIITLASLAGGTAYHFFLTGTFENPGAYVGLGLVTGFIYVLSAYHSGLYRIQGVFYESPDHKRVISSWAFAILVLTVILFILKIGGSVSRGSVICFATLGGIGLVLWRRLVKRQLRRALETGVIRGRRAVVLGDISELARFSSNKLLARFGVDEVERITWPSDDRNGAILVAVERAIERGRDSGVEELILATSWSDSAQLEQIQSRLRLVVLPVRLLPDRAVSSILARDAGRSVQSILVQIQRAPLSVTERLTKRILDIAIAGGTLVVLAPLMAVIAIAVKLQSSGPVIFSQRRGGFNDKDFAIYKFRTMTVLEDGPSVAQATRNDSRVSRIGRILRQTSIDELPQLFNVIKGDMSVVGPRPHAVAHDNEYRRLVANYAFRHHVKPGMSGWAQVNGCRGETPSVDHMAKRIELDLWYINNWSVALDLQILVRTCLEVFRRRNAY
jgi:Undecaprenyl-phosphate glucose phosphotransferase